MTETNVCVTFVWWIGLFATQEPYKVFYGKGG